MTDIKTLAAINMQANQRQKPRQRENQIEIMPRESRNQCSENVGVI